MKDSTVRTAGLLRAQKPTILKKIRDEMRASVEQVYQRGYCRTADAGVDCGGGEVVTFNRFVQFKLLNRFCGHDQEITPMVIL